MKVGRGDFDRPGTSFTAATSENRWAVGMGYVGLQTLIPDWVGRRGVQKDSPKVGAVKEEGGEGRQSRVEAESES
jgi:hypothetical protein